MVSVVAVAEETGTPTGSPADSTGRALTRTEQTPFRVRPIMRQGTASSIPETWSRFASLEEARAAVKPMYHDDRVLRVFIVTDDMPPQFVEWVDR